MELLTLKIIILTLSGVSRLIFGMIPMILMKCISKKFRDSKLKYVISVLMFFGGGVLVATSFLHMMPEVRINIKGALPTTEFPVAEIIFISGFFLVYLLEDMIHSVVNRRRRNKKEKKSRRKIPDDSSVDERCFQANLNGAYQSTGDITGKSPTNPFPRQAIVTPEEEHKRRKSPPAYPGTNLPSSPPPVGGVSVLPVLRSSPPNHINVAVISNNMKNEQDSQQVTGMEKFSYVDPDWWRDTVIANSQMNLLSNSSFSVASMGQSEKAGVIENRYPRQPHHHQNHRHKSPGGGKDDTHSNSSPGSSSDDDSSDTSHHNHCHSHVPLENDDSASIASSVRNLLIVIAISFHAVFEGLAIGLQGTERDLWYLFLAVSLHECTILFCIGVELISSKTKVLRMIMYLLVVSLVNPIGIAIGILITEKPFQDQVAHLLVVGAAQASSYISKYSSLDSFIISCIKCQVVL